MSRKKPAKPQQHPDSVMVTKRSAATSQLETAILLWFHDHDPVSIHALAVASNDCLHAIGRNVGSPSLWKTWLGTQPKVFQERAAYLQNFAKHGFMDLKGKVPYNPIHSELIMFDSVVCYHRVYGKKSPLMTAFWAKIMLEQPLFRTTEFQRLLDGPPRIDEVRLGELSRMDFLKEAGQFFSDTRATVPVLHLP